MTEPLSENLILPLNDSEVNIYMDKLHFIKNLGEGNFSSVQLMRDPETNFAFAVKMFHGIADDIMKDILNDINIGKSFSSRFKIDYYGGLKKQCDVWILMEPMDLSVKCFYKKILDIDSSFRFPGIILGYFSYCSVEVLEELHMQKVIHRDVKPPNMLINRSGKFKLCDFGISGRLKDSLVQSAVGTNAYLAPERIHPGTHGESYSIISDVWSLGLSILEVAEMKFPFSSSQSLMSQLNEIVNNPPPRLSATSTYHQSYPELNEFIGHTLVKDRILRYNYVKLKKLKMISSFTDPNYFLKAQAALRDLVIRYVEFEA